MLINLEIVACKLFQFGRVLILSFGKELKDFNYRSYLGDTVLALPKFKAFLCDFSIRP